MMTEIFPCIRFKMYSTQLQPTGTDLEYLEYVARSRLVLLPSLQENKARIAQPGGPTSGTVPTAKTVNVISSSFVLQRTYKFVNK